MVQLGAQAPCTRPVLKRSNGVTSPETFATMLTPQIASLCTSSTYQRLCVPLVGRSSDVLLAEAQQVIAQKPDVLEWRVDFFQGIADSAEVIRVVQALRALAGAIPLLFTCRSEREGGQPIALDEAGVLRLYAAVLERGLVQMADVEMDSDPVHIARARTLTRAYGVQLLLSFHDFAATPSTAELLQRFEQAQRQGADMVKVAVMPQRMEDVLTLLSATLQASQTLTIPVVSMSMGPLGALSRLVGAACGSAMGFARGVASSAPGQVPLDDMRAVQQILQRAMQIPGAN